MAFGNRSRGGRGGDKTGERESNETLAALSAATGNVPPHDLEAERAVLGGVLLDNTALATVESMVVAGDFYHPAHAVIFESVQTLSSRGEPVDVVTLASELRARERLNTVGGGQYLGELTDTISTIAHIENHARIVADLAQVRRMITTAHEIVARGYGDRGSADGFLDFAAAKVFEIAQKRSKSSLIPLETAIQEAFERIEKTLTRGARITGIETGFRDLDTLTSGMHPGQLLIVAARPAMGKCLSFDAEIVRGDGSVSTIEEIYRTRTGTLLTLGSDWKFRLTTPSHFVDDGVKPVFRVTTRLGRSVETTLTHPFLTATGWKPLEHVRVGEPVAVPRRIAVFGTRSMRECEVKLLGYLLGDGGLTGVMDEDLTPSSTARGGRDSSPSPSVRWERGLSGESGAVEGVRSVVAIEARMKPVPVPGVDAALTENSRNALTLGLAAHGLMGKSAHEKFVPSAVFTLPRGQLALFLNRLFATDGWATVLATGQAQLGYCTVSERMARQVQHLLLRFGIVAALRRHDVRDGEELRPAWQIDITDADSIRTFVEDVGIFGKEAAIASVLAAVSPRAVKDPELEALAQSDVYWDEVVSIEPVGKKQVYDLTIPETHNFVANDVCVHNTSMVLNITASAAVSTQKPVLFFSLEMPRVELANRLMCAEARVDQSLLRSNMLSKDNMMDLTNAASKLFNLPIYIDDSGDLTLLDLRAKARRMKTERDLCLIVIDYLQLMKASRDGMDSREREISEISRGLKALAKELEVPIVALSQLNRSPETRSGKDKRPQLSDLRESGAIEQDADVVMFIYRDEVYNRDTEDKGIAEIIVAKQRNGPTDNIRLRFIRELTKFENLAEDENNYSDTRVGGVVDAAGEMEPEG